MTVAELIEKLKVVPPDALVAFMDYEYDKPVLTDGADLASVGVDGDGYSWGFWSDYYQELQPAYGMHKVEVLVVGYKKDVS